MANAFSLLLTIILKWLMLFNSCKSLTQKLTIDNSKMFTISTFFSFRILLFFFSLSLDLVQVIGKRGRKVPVILTKDVKMAIDVLIATREQVGVARDNKYLFARANQQSRSYMRGWDCIRNVISEVEGNLERPDLITSTKLRKYVASRELHRE